MRRHRPFPSARRPRVPNRLHAGEQRTVSVEFGGAFVSRNSECFGTGDDHRHGHVHACHCCAVHDIDPVSGGETLLRSRRPTCCGTGSRRALRRPAPHRFPYRRRRRPRRLPCGPARGNPSTRVHCTDSDLGRVSGGRHKPQFDCRRPDAHENVAASWPEVDPTVPRRRPVRTGSRCPPSRPRIPTASQPWSSPRFRRRDRRCSADGPNRPLPRGPVKAWSRSSGRSLRRRYGPLDVPPRMNRYGIPVCVMSAAMAGPRRTAEGPAENPC